MKNTVPLNSKGLSVLFLIIAMLFMVTIGYVLTYLVPAKQRSVSLAIHSNQAFFIAQSGVEFAVRYAADQGWSTPVSLLGLNAPGVNQRNLGLGGFTISYDNAMDKLTSIGRIPNASERRIILTNFTNFVSSSSGLVLVDPVPCWSSGRTAGRFYIKNVGSSAVTVTSFSATWHEPPVRSLTGISIDAVQKFGGSYSSGSGVTDFTPSGNTQVVPPNRTVMVDLAWNKNISPNSAIVVSFYDSSGYDYVFDLDPEGDGLPDC